MPGVTPREKAVHFGTSAALAGVTTIPPKGIEKREDAPGIILLNSGILHHIGACRLHVELARRTARNGFTTLRFDHAGIGDSEPRRDTLQFNESAPLEVGEAMDLLQKTRGLTSFVLVGLCSGADMAYWVGQRDPRVVALVQMDPFAYRTRGYWMVHYGRRIFQLGPWIRTIGRAWRKLKRATETGPRTAADLPADFASPEYRRIFPPRDEVADGLRSLAARDVRLLSVFTGGLEKHFNHRRQFRASFSDVDFRGLLDVEFLPAADHIFTDLVQRQRVVDLIADWVDRQFPDSAPRAAAA